MTDDIVARLHWDAAAQRSGSETEKLEREAAQEIEWLRAALADIEELVDDYVDADDGQPNLAMRVQTVAASALRRKP